MEYKIEVTRDGRFWLIYIPALDGYTQAEYWGEVDYMARDYISLVTHTPIENISLQVKS